AILLLVGLIVSEDGAQAEPFPRGEKILNSITSGGHCFNALPEEKVLGRIVQFVLLAIERIELGLLRGQHGKEFIFGFANAVGGVAPASPDVREPTAHEPDRERNKAGDDQWHVVHYWIPAWLAIIGFIMGFAARELRCACRPKGRTERCGRPRASEWPTGAARPHSLQ